MDPDRSPSSTEPNGGRLREPRARRRLLGCAALLAFFAAAIWLVLRDDSPPEDADLLPPPIHSPVPLDETVCGALIEICAQLPKAPEWHFEIYESFAQRELDTPAAWPQGPLDRSVYADPELLARMKEYFERTDAVFGRLSEALAREQGGFEPRGLDDQVWNDGEFGRGVNEIRVLHNEQLIERALLCRASGDVAGASRWLGLGLRLAERFAVDGSVSLIHGIVSWSVLEAIWNCTTSLLHDGELDADLETMLISRSPVLERDPAIPIRILRWEYVYLRHLLRHHPQESEWLSRITLKPNRTCRRLAGMYRIWIEEWSRPASERSAMEEVMGAPEDAKRRAILSANVGEMILPQIVPDMPGLRTKFDRCLLAERVGRTIVALRAHERTRGVLPPDLGALVQAFPALDGVPDDPFTGAPLRYDPARRILWSAGSDGIDGGGEGAEALDPNEPYGRYKHPDWVWPIPPLPRGG